MQPKQRKRILFAMLIYVPNMQTVCCYVRPLKLVKEEYPTHA